MPDMMYDVKFTDLPKEMRQYLSSRIKFMQPLTDEVRGFCWVWQLSLVHGYAQGTWNGRTRASFHLKVLESVGRPLPDGLESDHLCCRRTCLNPDHVEYVTKQENAARVTSRGHHWASAKTHCKNGHEFTSENTLLNTGGKNRRCRECKLDQEKLRKRMIRTGTTDVPQPLTHCKQGHPLSGDNVRIYVRDGSLRRVCRTCSRENTRRYRGGGDAA